MRRSAWLFASLFVAAVAVNFAWEMAQSVLFAPMGGWARATSRCAAASVGDGLIVLAIAAVGGLLFRRADWFLRPRAGGYLFAATLGSAVAVLMERRAIATGRWTYTDAMPLIPALEVGVVPILQLVVLPPLAFSVAARWLRTLNAKEARRVSRSELGRPRL
jgi:hypothetical protein